MTQHKLDYDLLKQIQDHPEVKEVAGTHMVILVSISASHVSHQLMQAEGKAKTKIILMRSSKFDSHRLGMFVQQP